MRIGVVKQQIAQALGGQKQLSLQSDANLWRSSIQN